MKAMVVKITDDDAALAASIVRAHGRELEVIKEFAAQAKQCLRIADALCNARPLEDFLEAARNALEEHLTQLG